MFGGYNKKAATLRGGFFYSLECDLSQMGFTFSMTSASVGLDATMFVNSSASTPSSSRNFLSAGHG